MKDTCLLHIAVMRHCQDCTFYSSRDLSVITVPLYLSHTCSRGGRSPSSLAGISLSSQFFIPGYHRHLQNALQVTKLASELSSYSKNPPLTVLPLWLQALQSTLVWAVRGGLSIHPPPDPGTDRAKAGPSPWHSLA